MTLADRIKERYPNYGPKEIRRLKLEYEQAEIALSGHIEDMHPKLTQSPEYLSVERLATPLQKHLYSDICAYAWALKGLEGFREVRAVAEKYGLHVNIRPPYGADEYISPLIFYGYLWGSFRKSNIVRWYQLENLRLDISRKSFELNDRQYEALKARGIRVQYDVHSIFFEKVQENAFLQQYAEHGYVVLSDYIRSSAEVIEDEIRKVYPGAKLQFDRNYGVVIR